MRGRELGDVPRVMRDTLVDLGVTEDQIMLADSMYDGSLAALNWAQSEDHLLLLALDDRDQIFELLSSRI